MIPDAEITLLSDTVAAAVELAAVGHFAEGYSLLSQCWLRALQMQRRCEPGSAELVMRWRLACTRFVECYGVPLE